MSNTKTEIDQWTQDGHQRFKQLTLLQCGDGKIRTFTQWLEWQATRDPIVENLKEAALVRERLAEERRGPGIAKRRPSVKKAVAKKPADATDKKD